MPGCVGLVQAGAQLWAPVSVAASATDVVYTSTLAVYVLDAGTFELKQILARQQKSITAIEVSPHDGLTLAVASSEPAVALFELATEQRLSSAPLAADAVPTRLLWHPSDVQRVFLVVDKKLLSCDLRLSGKQAITQAAAFDARVSCVSSTLRQRAKLAIGLEDGGLWLLDLMTGRTSCFHKFAEPVLAVELDPLSDVYMLVALKSGAITLHDLTAAPSRDKDTVSHQVSSFAKHPVGLRGVRFIPNSPGGFVTYSDRSALLRLWNVSQPTSVALLKLTPAAQCGVHSVTFVPASAVAWVALLDGCLVAYDVGKRRRLWSSSGAHAETIFDCAFSPRFPELLATSSYDATVRLWHSDLRTCCATLTGASGPLYSLAWSPDSSRLAASGISGEIFMYDVAKGCVTNVFRHHTKAAYRVCWSSSSDPELLASASGDGTCVVFKPSGDIVRTLQLTAACFGCAFSPPAASGPRLLAVACADTCVHLFSLDTTLPARVLSKHTAKVFGVSWSTLRPTLLGSTSDDQTACCWDTTAGTCVVLRGHSANVRGFVFHPELPHVAITGAWDGHIRVWDVRTGDCLKTLADHCADVYGLSIHPQRPFALASSSRDATLRFWALGRVLCPELSLRAALGLPFTGSGTSDPLPGAPANGLLEGDASAELARQLDAEHDPLRRASLLFGFFATVAGTTRLWELGRVLTGAVAGSSDAGTDALQREHAAAPGGAASALAQLLAQAERGYDMLHLREVQSVLGARATRLEAARTARARTGNMKKEDALAAAAAVWLQLGNIEAYCELMRELKQWDRALAAAPAVGLDYWRRLMVARAEEAAEDGAPPDELMPLLAPAGAASLLQRHLVDAGQLEEAFAVDAAVAAGRFAAPRAGAGSSTAGSEADASAATQHARAVRRQQAESLLSKGEPALAAAALLTVDDTEGALNMLRRGDERELAVMLAVALPQAGGQQRAARLLVEGVDVVADRELVRRALRLLPSGNDEADSLRVLVAARLTRADKCVEPELSKLLGEFGLPSAAECAARAAAAVSAGDEARAALYFVTAQRDDAALQHGLAFLRREAGRLLQPAAATTVGSAVVAEATTLVRVLAQALLAPGTEAHQQELVAYASFFGALKAVAECLLNLVPALLASATRAASACSSVCPLHARSDEVRALQAALVQSGATRADVVPTGSRIPAGSSSVQRPLSVVSGQVIAGAAYAWPDGSLMTAGEAAAWSRCTPFSPLGQYASGSQLL